jgi:hypothetical protein
VENRGKGEYEVLVERISGDCGDETDLFLSVRNLNRHPLPLLPPPCCWIPYAIDYVQSHTRNTEHTLVCDNKQTACNIVTSGRRNGTPNEEFHLSLWQVTLTTGLSRLRFGVCVCVCVCVCVWSGGGIFIGQFFYNYASCTVYTGVSLWRSFRSWQELPQEFRSGCQGLWMPSNETSK